MIKNYNKFIKRLKRNRLSHYARIIENSGCKIMVVFDYRVLSEMDKEYNKWCKENCSGKYFVYNENYAFFDIEEDAVAFKLRWL